MLTIHRKYSGVAKEPVLYVADNGTHQELKGANARAWLDKICATGKQSRILSTSACSIDDMLLALAERGVQIFTAHWHSVGVDKKLEPGEIAEAFSKVADSALRPYIARTDLAALRGRVVTRNAVIEYRKSVANSLRNVGLRTGVSADRYPKWLKEEIEALRTNGKPVEYDLDKQVKAEAEKIPECVTFRRIFGMKDVSIVEAQFVSCVGDTSRFPTVGSLWHYCGQHVTDDGKAPHRKRGAANDWNPEARTVLWNTIDTGLKANNPVIRPLYEYYKAKELETHDAGNAETGKKPCKCETKQGHCGARARRRVTKELLKQYYVATGGTGQQRTVLQSTICRLESMRRVSKAA